MVTSRGNGEVDKGAVPGGGEGGSMGTGRDLALGSECAVHFADNVLLSHEPETCGTLLSNVALIHSSKKKI